MCGGEEITLDDLPPSISQASSESQIMIPSGITLAEAEKMLIQQNLK